MEIKFKSFNISDDNYFDLAEIKDKHGNSIRNLANALILFCDVDKLLIKHEKGHFGKNTIQLTIKAAEKLNKIKSKYKCTVNDVFSSLLKDFCKKLKIYEGIK